MSSVSAVTKGLKNEPLSLWPSRRTFDHVLLLLEDQSGPLYLIVNAVADLLRISSLLLPLGPLLSMTDLLDSSEFRIRRLWEGDTSKIT